MTAKNSFRGVFAISGHSLSRRRGSGSRQPATVPGLHRGGRGPWNGDSGERKRVFHAVGLRAGPGGADRGGRWWMGPWPLVAGITGVSAAHAIERARQAQDGRGRRADGNATPGSGQ